MKSLTSAYLWGLVLLVAGSQQVTAQQANTGRPDTAATQTGRPAVAASGDVAATQRDRDTAQGRRRSSQAARTSGIGPGPVERPGVSAETREAARQSSNPRREFASNAMKFDTNRDQQLAANELSSLFLVLASQLNRNRISNSTVPNIVTQQSRTTTSVQNAGAGGIDTQFASRQSVRQAVLIFLQIAMQFDVNGDGALNQQELTQLANAILQYNPALASGSVSTRTRQNSSVVSSTSQNVRTGTIRNPAGLANQQTGFGQRPYSDRKPSRGNSAAGGRGARPPEPDGSSPSGNSGRRTMQRQSRPQADGVGPSD